MSVPDRFAPLLLKAGIPSSGHAAVMEHIENFVGAMALLLAGNKDVAPNYLTFALRTDEGERYEFTVQKSEGLTPTERIDDLQSRIDQARKLLEDIGPGDCTVPGCDEERPKCKHHTGWLRAIATLKGKV